jgi:hypothetical protein
MRRLVPVLLAFVTGCSNAPLAGLLDCVAPARGGPPAADRGPPVLPDTRPPLPRGDLPPADDRLPPVGPRP